MCVLPDASLPPVLIFTLLLEDFHHVGWYGGAVPVFGVGVTVVLVGQCVLVLALP